MEFLEQYLNRANEIIGDRTKDEERYDKEVLRWLRKGKGIKKAINKANKKYPKEALKVDDNSINDVASHYDYLLEHDNIIRKFPIDKSLSANQSVELTGTILRVYR